MQLPPADSASGLMFAPGRIVKVAIVRQRTVVTRSRDQLRGSNICGVSK